MEIFDNVKFGQSVWEQLSGISGRGWCGHFEVVVWQTRGKLVTCFPVSVSRQGDMARRPRGIPLMRPLWVVISHENNPDSLMGGAC